MRIVCQIGPKVVVFECRALECRALYCCVYLENIGFVYPAMPMNVIGPSLLY
jgi:hypothetical protein